MTDATIIEPNGGEHIRTTAARMIAAAKESGGVAKASFNEIIVVATADSTVDSVAADYHAKREAAGEAYRKSPEGIAAKKKRDAELAALQSKHDDLMAALPGLDFTDHGALIEWLCEMQPASDDIGVDRKPAKVIAEFRKHGYRASENCDAEHNAEDRVNVARYIIGLGLSCLEQFGAIHGILLTFAERWREKFAA